MRTAYWDCTNSDASEAIEGEEKILLTSVCYPCLGDLRNEGDRLAPPDVNSEYGHRLRNLQSQVEPLWKGTCQHAEALSDLDAIMHYGARQDKRVALTMPPGESRCRPTTDHSQSQQQRQVGVMSGAELGGVPKWLLPGSSLARSSLLLRTGKAS